MLEKIKKHKEILWLVLSVVIVFCITLLFPYSGDDWDWGNVQINKNILWHIFCNPYINGRYLGNIFVVLMTKNVWIRGIVMSITLVSIVYLLSKKSKIGSLFIWLLLLSLPKLIMSSAVVWTSGFTNYVISALFLLLCIFFLEKNYKDTKWYFSITGLFLFFLSSLFIENQTVFLVLATFCMNAWYLFKKKKWNLSYIFSFIGSLVGCIFMFRHPAYSRVLDGLILIGHLEEVFLA